MTEEGGGASRTTHVASGTSTGTDVSLREHLEILRDVDLRFDAERDRRLTEVAVEREKALKIKETADLAALDLAREIQTYKDEKANELREQIGSERGLYASKEDLAAAVREIAVSMKPLSEYVTAQRGRSQGLGTLAAIVVGSVTVIAAVMAIVIRLVG